MSAVVSVSPNVYLHVRLCVFWVCTDVVRAKFQLGICFVLVHLRYIISSTSAMLYALFLLLSVLPSFLQGWHTSPFLPRYWTYRRRRRYLPCRRLHRAHLCRRRRRRLWLWLACVCLGEGAWTRMSNWIRWGRGWREAHIREAG